MTTEPVTPSLRRGGKRIGRDDLARAASVEEALTLELKPPLTDADASQEAWRCLECGTDTMPAPCQVACPADVDVPGFIAAIQRGQPGEAGRLIFAANPLGASCARVCPTEELCEGACVLVEAGQRPVDIGRLQRYAADYVLTSELPVSVVTPTRASVAVIGAGPAGLACAATLAARSYPVTVYDEHDEIGGLVREAIAPYRLSLDPLPLERHRLEAMGVRFRLGFRIQDRLDLEQLEREYAAIFLGVGLGGDVSVTYPGDDLEGIYESLPFIARVKHGPPPKVGRRVVVIGGGNTAIDVAREAVRLGAIDVVVAYRRTEAEMPAYRHELEESRDEGVQFLWLVEPRRFYGSDHVEAVEFQTMRLAPADESGRRRPEPIPGQRRVVAADTVVKAMGQKPRRAWLENIPGVTVERGRVVTDPATGRTGNPRYFAGGDAVNGGDTAVEAVRLGKLAADGIEKALREGGRS
jgi:dihydropyrimidine dehydrogenase (NAD+) subunit PreT